MPISLSIAVVTVALMQVFVVYLFLFMAALAMALSQYLLEGVIGMRVYDCCSYGGWYLYVAHRSVPTMFVMLGSVGMLAFRSPVVQCY